MRIANAKHMEKVDANREAVSILIRTLEESGSLPAGTSQSDESCLDEYCTLKTFDALKLGQLKAFIIAHEDKVKKISEIPKRGRLIEAKADKSLALA